MPTYRFPITAIIITIIFDREIVKHLLYIKKFWVWQSDSDFWCWNSSSNSLMVILFYKCVTSHTYALDSDLPLSVIDILMPLSWAQISHYALVIATNDYLSSSLSGLETHNWVDVWYLLEDSILLQERVRRNSQITINLSLVVIQEGCLHMDHIVEYEILRTKTLQMILIKIMMNCHSLFENSPRSFSVSLILSIVCETYLITKHLAVEFKMWNLYVSLDMRLTSIFWLMFKLFDVVDWSGS